MSSQKIDTTFWDSQRGLIRSRKGGWRIGEKVLCHGHDMIQDFMGKITYFQVLILNATGRLVERRVADWFEAIYIGLSWPDARIWCNQIGALGGTMGCSAVAATTAGVLAADSRSYAQGTLIEGMEFIAKAMSQKKQGLSAREIVKAECAKHGGKPQFMGYARPIAKGDERVPIMEKVSETLGFTVGKHLALAYEIEQILDLEYDESMNLTGYISAFVSDLEFDPADLYRICSIWVNSGVTACYVDAVQRPSESFLPMYCSDIDYRGPSKRHVPSNEER